MPTPPSPARATANPGGTTGIMTKHPTLILLGVLLTLGLCVVPAALAAPGPRVSWTLPSTANAGSAVAFSWTAKHLRPGNRLVIQRQEGTARSWQTVVRLPNGISGSAQLPGLPLGTYRLRMADLGSRARALAQQQRGLNVFGQVPLIELFTGLNEPLTERPVATATHTFQYLLHYYAPVRGSVLTEPAANNNCRSIHFDFVPVAPTASDARTPAAHKSQATEQGVLTLVQQSADPVSASAPYEAFGSLDASLTPGQSWALNLSVTGGENVLFIDLNGYAICDRVGPKVKAGFEVGGAVDPNA